MTVLALGLGALWGTGCRETRPEGGLVLTQTPLPSAGTRATGPGDVLDVRYPAGSRVVLALPPYAPAQARVLSQGLMAAGGPVVSPDGGLVYFVGKAAAGQAWQVYEADLGGGRPRPVTQEAGGAMDPAILPSGEVVFSAPVPKVGAERPVSEPPALYVQARGGAPRRLTFGVGPAVDPTVLADGRLLFVGLQPKASPDAGAHAALFTVNNDGTELTAFAGQHDGVDHVRRPRELPGGRVVFLASRSASGVEGVWAETVRMARPFASRERLLKAVGGRYHSVEPGPEGQLLVCLEPEGSAGRAQGAGGVYRLTPDAQTLGAPLFDEPGWGQGEAAWLAPRAKPLGHLSAMNPAKKTGTILCLNARFTDDRGDDREGAPRAVRVRVLGQPAGGTLRVLGELPLEADGSFMANAPADLPLGFETLDAQGRVMRRVPPVVWVRGGENRTCLGCHEPHNRSPRNVRPLAAGKPVTTLRLDDGKIAQGTR